LLTVRKDAIIHLNYKFHNILYWEGIFALKFFITNGTVAWSLPDKLAHRFGSGLYQVPEGWQVVADDDGRWFRWPLGEYRLNNSKKFPVISEQGALPV
jgi:hypothetical protein